MDQTRVTAKAEAREWVDLKWVFLWRSVWMFEENWVEEKDSIRVEAGNNLHQREREGFGVSRCNNCCPDNLLPRSGKM